MSTASACLALLALLGASEPPAEQPSEPPEPPAQESPAQEPAPEGPFEDPNRTRYLYAPSARMLRAGEVYLSQTELFITSGAIGVTDFLTLQLGSALPALLASNGLNFLVGLKVGFPLTDRLHVAGGAQVLVLPFTSPRFGPTTLLFTTATYGSLDAHLSVAIGVPLSLQAPAQQWELFPGPFIATVSGNLRLGRHVALVTENWIVPGYFLPPDVPMANALALRLFGEHWALDLGVVRIPYDPPFPLPWLNLTYNFG
jgi:hypothetical protein